MPYHHRDLPNVLLETVDEAIREHGAVALSLREIARRAEVSHAAPAHHFGDRAGLLTAYVTRCFGELRERLVAAVDRSADGAMLEAIGVAYVEFATEHPRRFEAMFTPSLLHVGDTALVAARETAFAILTDALLEQRPGLSSDHEQLQLATATAWASVHGFATLWIDGNLDPGLTSRPVTDVVAGGFAALSDVLDGR